MLLNLWHFFAIPYLNFLPSRELLSWIHTLLEKVHIHLFMERDRSIAAWSPEDVWWTFGFEHWFCFSHSLIMQTFTVSVVHKSFLVFHRKRFQGSWWSYQNLRISTFTFLLLNTPKWRSLRCSCRSSLAQCPTFGHFGSPYSQSFLKLADKRNRFCHSHRDWFLVQLFLWWDHCLYAHSPPHSLASPGSLYSYCSPHNRVDLLAYASSWIHDSLSSWHLSQGTIWSRAEKAVSWRERELFSTRWTSWFQLCLFAQLDNIGRWFISHERLALLFGRVKLKVLIFH